MRKKGTRSTILLVCVLLIGISLILYPSVSDYWNSMHQTQTINRYSAQVASLDTDKYTEVLEAAMAYNEALFQRETQFSLTKEEKEIYHQQLNVSANEVMGYIDIPSMDCLLPIYHTTDEAVLQTGIGHLEWTSLPVGGVNTHCVISGHRGLPSARLFTDLDQLQEGDVFMLNILDEILTYEVDQILIVEPDETEALMIQEGKDLCTLLTCTPYGINSHRLLVRGHRIEGLGMAANLRVSADAIQKPPLSVGVVLFVPIMLLLLLGLFIGEKLSRKR